MHAAEYHHADEERRVARHRGAVDKRLIDDLQAVEEGDQRQYRADHRREPQRRHGESGDAIDRQADQAAQIPGAAAFHPRLGFIIDAHLAKADPARQPFEEPVALRELAQGIRRARR